MELLIRLFVCYSISIQCIVSYKEQNCYICESNSCDYPSKGDVKGCSDAVEPNSQDRSGKFFVNGALNGLNSSTIYTELATNLTDFGTKVLNINSEDMPKWDTLTRWVCYVSKDNHRGCMVMAKGLCPDDKGWLAKFGDLGRKISNIVAKAKDAVKKMFGDVSSTNSLTTVKKGNISDWFAQNYMSRLVNTSTDPRFQLDTCCEGNACNNFPFPRPNPINILILVLCSVLLLV
ncbi:hypothetical protein I4U23_029018 [Adineta vaga]|nr:hypothetical protein I4U23_029018 [Adineta vaga]